MQWKHVTAVTAEMRRQDKLWGSNRDLDDLEWLRIVMEEVGECARASHDADIAHLREEVVQVIASNVQWLEAIDRVLSNSESNTTPAGSPEPIAG